MKGRRALVLVTAGSLIAILSCNQPLALKATEPLGAEPTIAFTLVYNLTTTTVLDIPISTGAPTETPLPSLTPTASLTPEPSPTETPRIVTLTVSGNTNCRTGPGTVYDYVDALLVGQTAEVVGRDEAGLNWIIKRPANPSRTCWLWGRYATLSGNWEALPIVEPPPTPTPKPTETPVPVSFSASYLSVIHCGASYAFRFQINNTGGMTLESIKIVVTDNSTATTFIHTLDAFRSYSGCGVENNVPSLAPGASANSANVLPGELAYNPAGHSITATIKVCTENGLGGECATRTVNFTP